MNGPLTNAFECECAGFFKFVNFYFYVNVLCLHSIVIVNVCGLVRMRMFVCVTH